MTTHTAHLRHDFDGSPQKVFALFASHERFGKALAGPLGTRLGAVRRIRTGEDGGDGIGSVRRIGYGPFAFDETIVAAEPGKRLEYAITRGSPLRHHHGTIEFSDNATGGTTVDYRVRFEPVVPGTGGALTKLLETLLGQGLRRMETML